MKRWMGLLFLIVGIGFWVVTTGCYHERVIVEERPVYVPVPAETGPPPWAPAHGHRAKHRYYYYPGSYVYFDVERRVYFYYRDAGWNVSVSLPVGFRIDVSDYVVLEMDTEKPYQYHSDVVKKYPPGQAKKVEYGKGKGKRD
jgi:hypothetical protein